MLHKSINQALNQIVTIIDQLQKLPETKQHHLYCELNIGKHIRHINDHFLAFEHGINAGAIDYNNRNRGTNIETCIVTAASQLQQLTSWMVNYKTLSNNDDLQKPIIVYSEINCLHTISQEFQSSVARELLYLINHTIHHAAHIALIAKHQGIDIPLDTGMAPCTMTFLRATNS